MSSLSSCECGVLFLLFFLQRVFYLFGVNWGYFVFKCYNFNVASVAVLGRPPFKKRSSHLNGTDLVKQRLRKKFFIKGCRVHWGTDHLWSSMKDQRTFSQWRDFSTPPSTEFYKIPFLQVKNPDNGWLGGEFLRSLPRLVAASRGDFRSLESLIDWTEGQARTTTWFLITALTATFSVDIRARWGGSLMPVSADNKMKTAALKDTLCFREGSMQVYCSALTAAMWGILSFRVKWQNWGSQLWGVPPDVQSRWQSPASWAKTAACGAQEGLQTQKVVMQRPERLRTALSNRVIAPDRVLLASNVTGG